MSVTSEYSVRAEMLTVPGNALCSWEQDLFPNSEDLGRGAIDTMFAMALTEQERNQETR